MKADRDVKLYNNGEFYRDFVHVDDVVAGIKFVMDRGENGEIYNYIELRSQLKKLGFQFKTQSDSEVILKAYECYGTACFQYFNGMFAIAIIDIKRGKLILARDRLGVKPLYYYQHNNELLFSSEIKTFKQYQGFQALNLIKP